MTGIIRIAVDVVCRAAVLVDRNDVAAHPATNQQGTH
jgi:hypothetical protein